MSRDIVNNSQFQARSRDRIGQSAARRRVEGPREDAGFGFEDLATGFDLTREKSTSTTMSNAGRGWPSDFEEFAHSVRRELAPEGLLEGVLVDVAARSAWNLSQASHVVEATRSERALILALEALDLLHERRPRRWGSSVVSDSSSKEPLNDLERLARCAPYHVEGHDWSFQDDGEDDLRDAPISFSEESDNGAWRSRLVFDPQVSEDQPVVKGTWVTTGHVVSLIVDGLTWTEILRTHPELTEEDIRACLAYTTEQDGEFSFGS